MTGRGLAVTLCLSLAAPAAHAQVPSPALWRAQQQPQDEPPRTEAAEAFAEGEAAFAEERYDDAVQAFTRAQRLVPHAHTLHNLGLAQARAGMPLEAWATFTALRDEALDPAERAEAELQLSRLAVDVARVTVHASSGQVVRIDGETIESEVEHLRKPGMARLTIGDQTLDVELRGGELRHVDLRTVSRPQPRPAPPRGRKAVLASTLVFGLGATGTATAAALLGPEGPRRPLAFTAAGLGGATVVLAATALALHLRDRRERR